MLKTNKRITKTKKTNLINKIKTKKKSTKIPVTTMVAMIIIKII